MKKDIKKSVEFFVKQIEKAIEEREENEILDFNECIKDAFDILIEYFEEQGLNVYEEIEWIRYEIGYYMTNESIEDTKEVYIPFELLDV